MAAGAAVDGGGGGGGGDEGGAQVLVRFVTRLEDPELHVTRTELAVPADVRRVGLSQVVNGLLSLERPRPFDFIVAGELVRATLHEHLLQHGVSPEAVVEVEYVPAVVPPEPRAAVPHDDWVTAVAAVGGYHGAAAAALLLASGSADGVVRLWRGAGEAVLEFAAHKGGVNALAPVPAAGGAAAAAAAQKHAGRKQQKQQQQQQQEQQAPLLLSAGKDHKLRLWCLQGGDGGAAPPAAARCVAEYCGHSDAVQAVAADPGGTRCASGGWDGQLLLWRAGGALADGEQAAAGGDGAAAAAAEGDDDTAAPAGRKKRKVGAAGAAAAAAPAQLEPLAPLMGHVHCVSALAWPRRELLLSGGWDHSVRRWDLTAGEQADSYAGSKVVLALAAPAASDGDGGGGDGGNGGGGSVVAFAGSDGALRLWDWRAPGEALAVRSVAAHAGGSWVAALAWRPGSAHHLASAGYDGRVKLWDVRSNVPLADLEGHGGGAGGGGAGGGAGGAGAAAKDKALCVGWWRPGTLVSGGSDCQLRLYEMPS